jgi:hypothetical protein
MLEGDLEDAKTSAKLQAAVDSELSLLAGYDEAIENQSALVAEATAKLEAERKAAAHKAAGEELMAQIAVVEDLFPKWLSLMREFAGHSGKAASVRSGANIWLHQGQRQ